MNALESFYTMLRSYPTQAEMASIHFALAPAGLVTVTVRLHAAEPAILAAGLVAWERTLGLTEVWARRTPIGNEVHVTLVGYGDCAETPITVVAGPIPHDGRHLDYDLEPDKPKQLDTDTLYHWLGTEITQTWPFKRADLTT